MYMEYKSGCRGHSLKSLEHSVSEIQYLARSLSPIDFVRTDRVLRRLRAFYIMERPTAEEERSRGEEKRKKEKGKVCGLLSLSRCQWGRRDGPESSAEITGSKDVAGPRFSLSLSFSLSAILFRPSLLPPFLDRLRFPCIFLFTIIELIDSLPFLVLVDLFSDGRGLTEIEISLKTEYSM